MKKLRLKHSFFILFVLPMILTACLETRDSQKEVEEKQVLRKQLTSLQTSTADTNSRFQDVEEENRRLQGRVEALEAKLGQLTNKSEKAGSALDSKLKEHNEIYKEEFAKINAEVTHLREEVGALREELRKSNEAHAQAAAAAREAENAKNPFDLGEEKYQKKQWKEAILDYEKYRSKNPGGKHFAAATYKIGICFQELGMIEEAKAFFEEIVAQHPKSKEAAKASSRIKALSKKKK
jgi:TolA-binding protein